MAEKGGARKPSRETTPEEFVTSGSSQLPSGDYSYTVELVGSMQRELGRLTEAVDELKSQSKAQMEKLDTVRMDIHAAKVTIATAGSLLLLLFGFIAWIINTYISAHPAK
jgi:hypothetical protein